MITVPARLPSPQSSERVKPTKSVELILTRPGELPPDFWEYFDPNQRYLLIDGVAACLEHYFTSIAKKSGASKLGIVAVTVGDLCGGKESVLDDIFYKASLHSLSCFPAPMPLQFRVQYGDQPRNENVLVAMNPIKTPFDTEPVIFGIAHDSRGMVLSLRNGASRTAWPASAIFLFSTGPVVESPLITHSSTQ